MRHLTDEDVKAIAAEMKLLMQPVAHTCAFSSEEIVFVRAWMDTMKTVKSETIKWLVKCAILAIGIFAAISVAIKMGWHKS